LFQLSQLASDRGFEKETRFTFEVVDRRQRQPYRIRNGIENGRAGCRGCAFATAETRVNMRHRHREPRERDPQARGGSREAGGPDRGPTWPQIELC
jgi:hypothetical protein